METALWRWQLQLFIFVCVEFCSKMLTLYVTLKITFMSSSNTEYTCIRKKILKMYRRDKTAQYELKLTLFVPDYTAIAENLGKVYI